MGGRSIRHFLLLSWLIPFAFAIAASAVFSVAISYLDYSNYRDSISAKLETDGDTIARRVAAEIMLKDQGRVDAVMETLRTEYKLDSIRLDRSSVGHDFVVAVRPIPGVQPAAVVQIAVSSRPFGTFVNFRNFFFALVPIAGLVFCGFLLQRHYVRKFIVAPIQELAETSIGNKSAHDHWPVEIQKISNELAESFSRREQAVYGHLVRGIIHDLRTYINSIHTALQLVEELDPKSDRRPSRIDKLLAACHRNVPKVQEIINLSLDSSREVTIMPSATDLSHTVKQSIENLSELAEAKKVALSSKITSGAIVSHDQIQIERALTNILKNAIEAAESMPAGSRKVQVSLKTAAADSVAVEIEDSGPGLLKPEGPFRPLKTTKQHGHGLGLFVSRKLIEAHQGQLISGKSVALGGAKFSLVLPTTRGEA